MKIGAILGALSALYSHLNAAEAVPFFQHPYARFGKREPSFNPEEVLLSVPSNTTARENLWFYTSGPGLAGVNRTQAEWTRDKFKEYGIDAEIVSYYPLLNYPVDRRLAIVEPANLAFEASLREAVVPEDPTSVMQDSVPTFHGLSANGDVTAELVYVNQGKWEDFEWLKSQGVNVTGKICIARYGGVIRGLKVRHCHLNGGVGTLIYSDPADDGPVGKKESPSPYPNGPWRNKDSVQRGSVGYIMFGLGDPLTPGVPATKDAQRIPAENNPVLPQIPSLPISWGDAEPLLKSLEGHGVNVENPAAPGWKGGLNITYWTGPSQAKINLRNKVEFKTTEIWNVIARIKGATEPDRAVIIGNHRDAWGFGAVDPHSGSASLLEIGRSFGELLKRGWKPKRTIVFGSWDAEEYGIMGSTEWVEDNQKYLRESAVAYINLDSSVAGPNYEVGAAPILRDLIRYATQKVNDPKSGKTVYEAWQAYSNATVGELGAGSDFGAFLDFIGIPSMDMSFNGNYGVYHSNYDSFYWMSKFGDPTFEYMPTMSKIINLMAYRLSDSDILPFNVSNYPPALLSYVDTLEKLVKKYSDDGAASPLKLDPLRTAISQFATAIDALASNVTALENERTQTQGEPKADWSSRVQAINQRLMNVERAFIDQEGLPKRPWFKHQIFAPGVRYGYDVQFFPAVADYVEEKNWTAAAGALERVVSLINGAADKFK
ncbi:uncharacterized protein VTP21DRAFT_11483 [Calcarisporiella thermophila]|uniref:uncharacterized protein n=1 Tax=Calcarisporiella thermophila TaxID=911321 RepID=UPI0037428A09